MKIAIAGQIEKEKVLEIAKQHANSSIEFIVMSDLEGAMALKNNEVDYYLGACMTGGGGALAMPIALVGADSCITLASPSNTMSEEEITNAFNEGKKAFGFVAQASERIVPIVIKLINNKI